MPCAFSHFLILLHVQFRLALNSRFEKFKDTTDELTQFMSKLDMNDESQAIENDNNDKECLFDMSNGHSRTGVPRKSLDHHSSSSDLNAQMHGATPVPHRGRGRPPRLSLQSASSASMDTQSPFVTNSHLSKPAHIDTHVSCGMNANDFVST